MHNKKTGINLIINYHLDIPFVAADKETVMNVLAEQIKQQKNNFIGFKNKKKFIDFVSGEIYGFVSANPPDNKKLAQKEIGYIVKKTIDRCFGVSKNKSKLIIHIFPSYNKFINEQMSGVGGYTSDSQNILIFISPQKGWQTALKNTLAHEFAHTKAFEYQKWQTLLDSLIFEGLAENFRERAVGGNPAPWSVALNKMDAKKVFVKIKKFLNSKNEKLYSQVFLGYDHKFPLWSGYAIGYQIIKSYFKFNKNKPWPEIFKLKPKEILKTAKY